MAVMRNMDPKKCPMPSQEPNVRNKNFNEVALGYTYEMAVNEAKRCLNCPKKPCRSACPVQIDIPAFIERVANEDMEGAYKVLTASSALPAVCGRVCPQETQCEGKCVRGIKGEPVGIGRLERFVADWHNAATCRKHPAKPGSNGHKVAVIGAGPSGLTCAGDLAKMGYKVTDLRSPAPGRRRACLRHSGVPSAQGHRAEGNRRSEGHGRGYRNEHGHRQGAHHRRAV